MSLDGLFTAQFFVSALVLVIVVHAILISVAYLIYVERKVCAYIQDRIGPNRVGFDFGIPQLRFLKGCFGLGQPLADGLKFFLKEDYAPDRADKVLFTLAPALIVIPALIGFAVIPWGGLWQVNDFSILGLDFTGGVVHVVGANINVGIIYLLAVASLGVYGVALGGWASNNKYSFLGSLRATSQMISYEIPLGLSLLAVLLLVGSLLPRDIINYQLDRGWLVFSQPVACILFLIAILAEANRAPFDNAECEQELVGGYHTEYSSMRFALFFMAEYSHLVTSCSFFVLLFLGGFEPIPFLKVFPDVAPAGWGGLLIVLAKFAIFFGKALTLVAFTMVIRWTLPRLRFDQVMMGAWQGAIPLALIVVVVTSIMVYLDLRGIVPMLLANGVMVLGMIFVTAILPRSQPNKRLPLTGSRFFPTPGETVRTAPSHPAAIEDRPVQGTVQVAG